MGCASTRVAVAVVGDVTQHKKVNDLKVLARLSGNKDERDEDTDMDNVKEVLAGTTGQPSTRFEVLHGLQPDQLLVVIKGDNVDSSLREMAQKKYIKKVLHGLQPDQLLVVIKGDNVDSSLREMALKKYIKKVSYTASSLTNSLRLSKVLNGLQPDQLLVVIKGDNVDSSLREMAQKKYIKIVLHGLQPDQLLVVIKGDNVDSSLREMAQKKYIKMLASQMKGMAKKGELKLNDGREIASVVIEGEEGVGASIPVDPK
ncbi:Hypp5453 [Branchiostoma lanceolatum]|uniref:Hypp5453 protein n=1 Tax=Branchiostoma lanceolatum TaxID=7740 RepID=A0A8J9VPM7_BRALA|nr:Hypp5453 [Branchiostoma lanceolatum]